MKRPNTFIVGLPRAATTSLSYYLREHPDVFFPDHRFKEPHFFSDDIYPQQIKGLESYLNLFQEAHDEKIVAEASVHYLFSESAPKKIKEFCPDAKIIICLRHPVDFIVSYHKLLMELGREERISIIDIIKMERSSVNMARKNTNKPPNKSIYSRPNYNRLARYSIYINNYINEFKIENIHFFLYEIFVQNPDLEYSKILNFLGIRKFQNIDFGSKINSSNTLWAKKIISKNRLIRFIALQFSASLRHRIANIIFEIAIASKEFLTRSRSHLRVSDETVYLHQTYFEEISIIEKITELNLNCWKQKTLTITNQN